MRSHLFGLGIAIALPIAVLPLFCLPPAHADEELSGAWIKGSSGFAQRQKAGTSNANDTEDDKDVDDHGGVTTFNSVNMEVKCQATRSDSDEKKTASGKCAYVQNYRWEPYGTNQPPSPYFKVDITRGTECNASPIDNRTLFDQSLRPGHSVGTGPDGSANNSTVSESHFEHEEKDLNRIITVSAQGFATGIVSMKGNLAASAIADSHVLPQTVSPGGEDGGNPSPAPPTATYTNKGCFAEGRGVFEVFPCKTVLAPSSQPLAQTNRFVQMP